MNSLIDWYIDQYNAFVELWMLPSHKASINKPNYPQIVPNDNFK